MTSRARRCALLTLTMAAAALSGCNLGLGGGASDSAANNSGTTGGSPTQNATYSLGGTVSGLTASGLTLQAGASTLAVAAGASSFTFTTLLASGASYSVAVGVQPQGQTCSVSHGNGMVAQADITTVQIACTVNTYTIGGTITGLNAAGLVLANGSNTLSVALGSSAFLFSTKVAVGASYAVTVQTPPGTLNCQVQNGSGVMGIGAIANVAVVCGTWSWVGGANSVNAAGSYGSRGSPTAGNVPGAREPAAAWLDASGNLWLFGGDGGSSGLFNDVWRYSPSGGAWTWMGGSSSPNANGVYGPMNAPGNTPGARAQSTGWADQSGNLWLFGGAGLDVTGTSGELNDRWSYQITSGQWNWMSGADVAWASGSAPPAGQPGPRTGAVSWQDGSGNTWLFGGNGTQGLLNDLWEYVAGTGWTLVTGATTPNPLGVYGVRGKPAATNVPGGREQAAAATDASGNLWLFGGTGYGALGNAGPLNDLWMFSPATGQWTWVNGWNTPGAPGVYGTSSSAAPDPGARAAAAAAADGAGDLFLFGGTGEDARGHLGPLSDLWEYDIAASQWIWMGGPQSTGAAGVYGSQGVAAVGNAPGARFSGAAWLDAAGNFWLFGGQGADANASVGRLNDLWEFIP